MVMTRHPTAVPLLMIATYFAEGLHVCRVSIDALMDLKDAHHRYTHRRPPDKR